MSVTVKTAMLVAAGLLVSIAARIHAERTDSACRRTAREWLATNPWHHRPAETLQPNDLDME